MTLSGMRNKLTLEIEPAVGTGQASQLDARAKTLGPRHEERSRWLMFADLALRKKEMADLISAARSEQAKIKEEIRSSIDKYRKLRPSKVYKTA